jgi:hypothetical protein
MAKAPSSIVPDPAVPPVQGAKQRLLGKIAALDDPTCEVLETIVAGLSARCEETIDRGTDIAVPAFAKNFRTRLQFHHATHEEVFKKKTFEYAFKAACIVAGKKSEMDPDVTSPGYDVIVDKVRYLLKTEAGANMSPHYIKISKLMEARWIRECRTGEDFLRGTKRIMEHFTHYDRVLVLRAFKVATPFNGVRYDLLEIPLGILKLIGTLSADDFAPRNETSGSTTAPVKSDGVEVLKLRLDGSVEKVMVEKLPVSRCWFHARWIIETLLAEEE